MPFMLMIIAPSVSTVLFFPLSTLKGAYHKDQTAFTVTDAFTLVGYWDYDELMPVHYINISRDYADDIEAQAVKTGLQPFRTDLNVMMASGTNIQGQMEQVDTDLGYTWDSYTDPNSVRIGVNWGYTSSSWNRSSIRNL